MRGGLDEALRRRGPRSLRPSDRSVLPSNLWSRCRCAGDDKSLLEKGKGPFGSTLVFKDGEEIKRRFGEAASSVGAIVDTVVLADAACASALTYCRVKPSQRLHPHRYYVGYAGLSTFDRTLVDIRATQNQYDARMARPDNCTFTVGKNKQRGVADHVPNAPAGRVYMRHFRSLP